MMFHKMLFSHSCDQNAGQTSSVASVASSTCCANPGAYKIRRTADYIHQIQRELVAIEAASIIHKEIQRIRKRYEVRYDAIAEENESDADEQQDDERFEEPEEEAAWHQLLEVIMEAEESGEDAIHFQRIES